ncbi:uncharacterized protein KIAA1143 homolog [Corythoichthys intestinalis]|uniref:uncharacterized protein KIAA1143 homolog n=1 Tax=Corythoichthys intestinalis TaxID=161448 RepID=UPI0025A5E074|nr:uncharacterized protein KIAA1143 homolog [Corythoichthys intestinalis]XP_061789968.1 uncharacterized protein KIAA1143 homolog [Nerophis lumbriciformis]
MNKSKGSGVSWVKPAEPSFLTKFKTDVGYKEGPTVDTKRQEMPSLDDDSGSDREDELPQVVVLQDGDLTSEEVKDLKEESKSKGKQEKSDEAPADGKIIFKKPAKRSSTDKFQGITASSSKKPRNVVEKEEKKDVNPGKKVKNSSLLSFGGDEEEEED